MYTVCWSVCVCLTGCLSVCMQKGTSGLGQEHGRWFIYVHPMGPNPPQLTVHCDKQNITIQEGPWRNLLYLKLLEQAKTHPKPFPPSKATVWWGGLGQWKWIGTRGMSQERQMYVQWKCTLESLISNERMDRRSNQWIDWLTNWHSGILLRVRD